MSNLNPISNVTGNMTQSGNGIAFGMRASGVYAPSVMELPCSVAGAVTTGVTPQRHADVAFEHDQGTLVWSPPT
jgi:hypothetical protein